MSTRRPLVVAAASLLVAACSDGSTAPSTSCNTTQAPVSLAPLQGATVRAAQFGRCLQLAVEGGANYLVVPQFAAEGPEGDPTPIDFVLGTADAADPNALASVSARSRPSVLGARGQLAGVPRGASAAERFHRMLRRQEAALAASAPAERRASALRAQISAAQPAPSRSFKVLSNLNGTEFATITAQLKYVGSNIYVYVDDESPTAFTDPNWQNFGQVFDNDLFPIDLNAFGSPSDIDANGHVIVLFTPVVNGLVDPVEDGCGSYVAGFFTGFDLVSTSANSNRAEVFYASVPDPTGSKGCPLPIAQVNLLTPATFIHELQHMISYNEHVLTRNGREENVWLNEGLSLIAEELGAKHYEEKYPAPLGRTRPDQLFPDSARGFIEFNLGYAYDWLTSTRDTSITTFDDFGSLSERGAAWIFLRWLGDQKGEAIYRTLVQTNLRGIANVSAAAGESFPTLFGDFSVALWTDSLPGVAREAIPPRYRFTSRNFREIYGRLSAQSPGGFPRIYPVDPTLLDFGTSDSGSMPVGTMDFFVLRTAGAPSPALLRFSRPDRTQLPNSAQAQVSIFRLPDSP